MSIKLSEFTEYGDMVIQCHDDPDADALASGFALKWYLDKKGINARFIYGGRNNVQKSNLVLMMERLNIEAEYITELEKKPELLVLVDCQYGQSNVKKFEAEKIAVIDHHQVSGKLPEMSEVRSNYGACSTILYEMLLKEGFDINEDVNLATALYYGLMTDTNGFSEIYHPSDKDLRDFAKYSQTEIVLYKNSNLSMDELRIAGDALQGAYYNTEYSYGIIEAEPCDPNILGIISDMLLEVDSVKTCLVYSILSSGIKMSVRSCTTDVKASELAAYLAEGYGGGGGHLVKAGGFLQRDLIEAGGIKYERESLDTFLRNRMEKYSASSEILYAGEHKEDLSRMKFYIKKKFNVGYIHTTDIAPEGSSIRLRTLEGDVSIHVEEDAYIIIGVEGEIYPIKKNKFEISYKPDDSKYSFPGEYEPSIIDTENGQKIEILSKAKSCISMGGAGIYAREIDHRVKIFTAWDKESYYLGVDGDYLAARGEDPSDIYIIARHIFDKTYSEAPRPDFV